MLQLSWYPSWTPKTHRPWSSCVLTPRTTWATTSSKNVRRFPVLSCNWPCRVCHSTRRWNSCCTLAKNWTREMVNSLGNVGCCPVYSNPLKKHDIIHRYITLLRMDSMLYRDNVEDLAIEVPSAVVCLFWSQQRDAFLKTYCWIYIYTFSFFIRREPFWRLRELSEWAWFKVLGKKTWGSRMKYCQQT